MKRFVLVLTDKGGTGKTLFTRALSDRLLREGVDVLLVDGDGEVGGLYQYYKDENVKTLRFTGTERDRDEMMSMMDFGADVVLVDMPAASLIALEQFDKDVGFFAELKRAGYRATLINVLSPFKVSTRTVKQMITIAGDDADYGVVINNGLGDKEDFFLWFGDSDNKPSAGIEQLEKFGGKEITMPKLQTGVLVAIDAKNIQFRAGISDESPLSRIHRSRLVRWMSEIDKQLDLLGESIGLKAAA